MAGNSSGKGSAVREFVRRQPSDVMVATFSDRDAASGAYRLLRLAEREGQVRMDSAVVLDRDDEGRMRVTGAKLPQWMWIMAAIAAVFFLGLLGVTAFLVYKLIRNAMES